MTTRMIILLFSVLVGNSKASETDDRNGQTESAVGNCIRSKWEVLVSVCDVNNDGKVSGTDLEQARKRFTKLTKLRGQEKKLREGMFTKWFKDNILWNQHEIAEKDYGAIQKDAFLKDKDSFVEKVKTNEDLYLNLVNIDNNDYLSEKEETTLNRALGLTNEKKDKAFFKAFDPEDKGLLITNVSNYWVSYFTDDNCTKNANRLDILEAAYVSVYARPIIMPPFEEEYIVLLMSVGVLTDTITATIAYVEDSLADKHDAGMTLEEDRN